MIDKKYNSKLVEEGIYDFWIENDLFKSDPNSKKKPFSIVIPPPNVTGKLHLGHAWDGSIQDLLIRFKKMQGYDTLWVPGMDHAGIATQSKVEQRLNSQGISRHDLGRENFVKKIWEWKEEYASTIRQQWKKMGLSLDYSRESFTYSEKLNQVVNKVFTKMYNDKLIYKAKKIINWDPKFKTALSNIEVIYKEINGHMYYIKYFDVSKKDFLLVATTRPETMFGDVCLVVNPNDERFKKYIGEEFVNPSNDKKIKVIGDDYVDSNFGTGVMKCTPAHDQNDYEIGLRHNLEMPIIMNEDGTLNEKCLEFSGLDRFKAREQLINKLNAEGYIEKIEDITHQVGFSERSDVIVEPYLSNQWFVKMKDLAKKVIENQNSSNVINFFPERFNDTLITWMENAHDWTISRQLWWGHRIPVWYNLNNDENIYVGEVPPKDIENWKQDEDVLDTWFSSALWPFSTLDWNEPDKTFFERYFPTSVLVTGYDIIFFWVARMIFQSLEFTNKIPFKDVLIHGLIRDSEGKKMSKSLGNGIDPMDVIEEYGADALRFSLLTNSAPGLDLRFSTEKLRSSWNFINKLWNASRFVLLQLENNYIDDVINISESTSENTVDLWILSEFSKFNKEVTDLFDKYEFTIAGKKIYDFVWNKYCSWYIELSKVNLNSENKKTKLFTLKVIKKILKNILIICHPIIPFVTEFLYKALGNSKSILTEKWSNDNYSFELYYFNDLIAIIEKIRDFRQENNLPNKTEIFAHVTNIKSDHKNIIINNLENINNYLKKIANCNIQISESNKNRYSTPLNNFLLEIDQNNLFDNKNMLNKLISESEKLQKELKRSENILSNKNFLEKASPEKIKIENNKYNDYKNKYELLLLKIKELKNE